MDDKNMKAFKIIERKYKEDYNELYDVLYNYMNEFLHERRNGIQLVMAIDEVENLLGIRSHEKIIEYIVDKI